MSSELAAERPQLPPTSGVSNGNAAESQNPAEPISTEPVSAEPVSTEPVSTEPVSTEPVSTEPVSTEPVSTEPASTETTPRKAPLASLLDTIAATPTGRRIEENLPPTAEPIISRGSHAVAAVDKVLVPIRDTFETEEGRNFLAASRQFITSLCSFVRLIFAGLLTTVEKRVGAKATSHKTCMAERCVGVSRKALSRASDWVDKRKEKVDGTCEAQMYVVMGRVFVFVYGLLMSGLGALTVFSGPGSDHVVSAANNVVSALPEDLQKDVRESKPPLPYLRDCLGFDAPNVSGMPPSSGTTSTSSEPTDTQGEN